MKQVDTLIISGASITNSPWFTWADIVTEILQPRKVIDVSARGTGNYYIALSCINAILNTNADETVLCMPMFTNIDKFDMYIAKGSVEEFQTQKHPPLTLDGKFATKNTYGFWCTGSHWPEVKQLYQQNFYNNNISAINNILIFYSLSQLCQQRNCGLVPLFDSAIWQLLEKDLNELVLGTPLEYKDFLASPEVAAVSKLLDQQWFDVVPLINYAIDHGLPFYNDVNKMHPPSEVHYQWVKKYVCHQLSNYDQHQLSAGFMKKLQLFTSAW
jgi:hypothetical protein